MKTLQWFGLAGVMIASMAGVSLAQSSLDIGFGAALARPAPVVGSLKLTTEKLQEMLKELGYQPKLLEVSGQKALQVKLGEREFARDAMVAIDQAQHVLIILSGGFNWNPQPARGDHSFYRKLLKINNDIAPSYIFLNEGDVFGLASVAGDSQVTTDSLKGLLAKHQERFEQKLAPLVQELAPAPAPQ